MPEIEKNVFTWGLSGKLGPYIIRQFRKSGKIFLSRRALHYQISNSRAAVEGRTRFAAAVQYGKQALADPSLRAIYQAKARRRYRIPFNVAIADAMSAPTIPHINTRYYTAAAGSEISIIARDDMRVEQVTVSLYDPQQRLLETGPARKDSFKDSWGYRLQGDYARLSAVILVVAASDLPGNTTVREDVLLPAGGNIYRNRTTQRPSGLYTTYRRGVGTRCGVYPGRVVARGWHAVKVVPMRVGEQPPLPGSNSPCGLYYPLVATNSPSIPLTGRHPPDLSAA
ncbi:hypothetical protein KTO58_01705 [Chitinophaga pendula]|uniref:hypothetical protein n=1 Tax=Chitinophaga TaxID=79328 RepID=UPI000BAF2C76|nr:MULTISPECIES: hypothetical protein [Chitinophaga]ASZ14424.1 hypothetical protein CK934_27510 [Chitinophaga sp. MD30]UCJ07920.1 hypothetical protein KTO58_01705 [Chitinophaga pendula]